MIKQQFEDSERKITRIIFSDSGLVVILPFFPLFLVWIQVIGYPEVDISNDIEISRRSPLFHVQGAGRKFGSNSRDSTTTMMPKMREGKLPLRSEGLCSQEVGAALTALSLSPPYRDSTLYARIMWLSEVNIAPAFWMED